ncbi:hydroxypyruvate isomerase family protein [Phenylobacterium sp.]|jgi:hydroxypyruvate isomerase|uniref:hydroxypyruvate isomerase family protein n=1 Tax=Phenylobacterium sp. TaxID=1871053 RepID=UPI002F42E23E
MASGLSRRRFLEASAIVPAGAASAAAAQDAPAAGRLKQSVCRWTLRGELADVCGRLKALGFQGVDLLYPDEWDAARAAGLTCSMGYASRRKNFIPDGFNDPSLHPMLIEELNAAIPRAAQAGVPNLIAMFGNRRGRSDAEGIANCVAGLSKVAPLAEQHGVTICVELLNSKVDHHDYQGDHTAFGAEVMRKLNSPRMKLLYDIYHMQIMEGDVIRTVREHQAWIGHFHTGGVPGRHEIGEAQELNYPAIARAIADVGFQGFVAHEFIATGEPYAALAAARRACLV